MEGDEDLFEDLVYSAVDQKKSNKKARGSQLKGVEIVVAAVPDDEDTDVMTQIRGRPSQGTSCCST